MDEELRQRLHARLKREGECLVCEGTPNAQGNVRIKFRGKYYLAHRLAYEDLRGPIPPGKFLKQTCGNRACCEEQHWWLDDAAITAREHRTRWHPWAQGLRPLAVTGGD